MLLSLRISTGQRLINGSGNWSWGGFPLWWDWEDSGAGAVCCWLLFVFWLFSLRSWRSRRGCVSEEWVLTARLWEMHSVAEKKQHGWRGDDGLKSISNSNFICNIHSTICSKMLIQPPVILKTTTTVLYVTQLVHLKEWFPYKLTCTHLLLTCKCLNTK